jgi:catechol 2,3-dioxygenase-like lactoylglutathione lyase family enzyme
MALATLGSVVLDCPDPRALAAFYAEVLGGKVTLYAEEPGGSTVETEGEADWVVLRLPDGQELAFQSAPGHVPPRWPSSDGSQQFHLDLTVENLDAAEKEVLALGAKVLDAEDQKRTWRVYADPAGHPFCLCSS